MKVPLTVQCGWAQCYAWGVLKAMENLVLTGEVPDDNERGLYLKKVALVASLSVETAERDRHYGIVLSENGAEMHVIQAMLGHSSVRVTEEHYAHFSPHYAARRAFQVLQGRKKGGINRELKSA